MFKQNARMTVRNPCSIAAPVPTGAPLLSDLVRLRAAERPKINFRGWSPGLGWDGWVRDMARRPDVLQAWRNAGIEDAIWGSVTNLHPDHQALEALAGFWSPSSRTFVFPWGEAAFTLEDAHILSNLPISGSRLDRELTDVEKELSERLFVEREKIRMLHRQAKHSRRVTLNVWLDWFLDLRGEDELKFLGFLTYWLVKNVIPANPSGEVPKVGFDLAARLSCGDRIALAPVVTANIFDDLTRITNLALDKNNGKRRGSNNNKIWTPFWLIQAWIWERFGSLSPSKQDTVLSMSRSRISRWDNKKRNSKYDEAIQIYRDKTSYKWRPYSENPANWKEPSWYNQQSQRICTSEKEMPNWMGDFLVVISPSVVQGFYGDNRITSERYQPHRVARQFGYDQAIPFPKDPLASLWVGSNVCRVAENIYIPEVTRSGNPRGEYLAWWQKYISDYDKGLHRYALPAPDTEKDGMHLKEDRDKDPVVALLAIQKNRVTQTTRSKREQKENNENSVLLAEDMSSQREDNSKENGQCLDGLSQNDKGKGYDVIISKSLTERIDSMDQNTGRKRKLIGKQSATRRRKYASPGENIAVIDLDIGVVGYENDGRSLVDELEVFKRNGLLSASAPDSPKFEMEEDSRYHYNSNTSTSEDPYGQEAVKMYPKFFELIPQRPHYKGLLDNKVTEDIRQDVYISKWYKLVDLMRRTLETSCQTPASEFEKLMQEAERYKEYGFNVKHIIARLQEPQDRLMRLKEAGLKLEETKMRENQAKEERQTLKRHIHEIGSKLKALEKKIENSQGVFSIEQQDNTSDIVALRKEVEDAETNLLVVEHDVEAMNIQH